MSWMRLRRFEIGPEHPRAGQSLDHTRDCASIMPA